MNGDLRVEAQVLIDIQLKEDLGNVVEAAMIRERDKGSQEGMEDYPGLKGWEEHISKRRLDGFTGSVINDPANRNNLSIWAVALLFNKADQDMTMLTSWDREAVSGLVGILHEKAIKVFGEEKANKIEDDIYEPGNGPFDPKRLAVDVFTIAGAMVETLQNQNLLLNREVLIKKLQKDNEQLTKKIEQDSAYTNYGKGLQYLLALVSPQLRAGKTEETLAEELKELEKNHPHVFKVANAVADRAFREAFGQFSKENETEKKGREKLEAAIGDLPLMERMAIMLKGKGEFEVEVSGKDIQPLMECFLPDVSLLKALPETELSINGHHGEKGMGITIRLGKMAEKKGGQEFEGIMVDFVLGSGRTGLTRSGDVDFEPNLPGKTKMLLGLLGKTDQRYSLDYIKEQIITRTGYAQATLNEWLMTEMKKRGINITSAEIRAEIVDNNSLRLRVSRLKEVAKEFFANAKQKQIVPAMTTQDNQAFQQNIRSWQERTGAELPQELGEKIRTGTLDAKSERELLLAMIEAERLLEKKKK